MERYFALSTSNDPRAVTDCFAQSWRDKNRNFADGAAIWSRSGPAVNVVVTPMDVVKGCDRFRVMAEMPNNMYWYGSHFFSVGPDAGRARIFEASTALANDSITTLRCG